METILWSKHRRALGLSMLVLLTICATTTARSSDKPGGDLTTDEIFKKVQATYASLRSYSDEGTIVDNINSITTTFHIKMAQPNLYRIEWMRATLSYSDSLPPPKTKVVWCMGGGDFVDLGYGIVNETEFVKKNPQKLEEDKQEKMSREIALSTAGMLAKDIPQIFFNVSSGHNALNYPVSSEKRAIDEKVGNVDCYVFSNGKFETRTLWIGKQDFLIYQIRRVVSIEDSKASLAEIDNRFPYNPVRIEPQAVNYTETHTNIVVNKELSPADFK